MQPGINLRWESKHRTAITLVWAADRQASRAFPPLHCANSPLEVTRNLFPRLENVTAQIFAWGFSKPSHHCCFERQGSSAAS